MHNLILNLGDKAVEFVYFVNKYVDNLQYLTS
jgi:hypothetical protein